LVLIKRLKQVYCILQQVEEISSLNCFHKIFIFILLFSEILRLLDSLQLSARLPVATPVDWKVGEKVMVPPNVKDEDVAKHFPQGVEVKKDLPSGKGYIRMAQV